MVRSSAQRASSPRGCITVGHHDDRGASSCGVTCYAFADLETAELAKALRENDEIRCVLDRSLQPRE
ncbi:MAG: hypothetical protein CL933_11120 [Deltaproteobacteria bacterium]|nr:hypothetical protein [Deltaproteobacteria bacterium]